MRKTKLLMVAFLAMLGSSVYAIDYEVDQKFTTIPELDDEFFAIVDETSETAFGFGIPNLCPNGWDMYPGTFEQACSSNACYFKISPAQGEGLDGYYYLNTYNLDGVLYNNTWAAGGYFNSQTGAGGYFSLGLKNQNGQDALNHAVWAIEVNDDGKFAIKNVGTGKYVHNDTKSNTYTDPYYFTFCTLKETAASILARHKARFEEIRLLIAALDDDTSVFEGDAEINLTEADAAVENATTPEDVDAAIELLYQAATSFVTSVTVKEGKYFDLSNIWMVNPTVRQNIDGWTVDGTPNPSFSWGKCANNECEFYQQNFDFYQTLTLPKGTYQFGVTGFHREGNHSTYFYAGEDKELIDGVAASVVNSMSEAETYFNNGNGKVILKFALENESNTIKIGIVNTDTETDKWTIFRDFTLYYYGSECDYSGYEERWNTLVQNAGIAKTNHPNVTGNELTDLNAAIDDAPDGSSKANYIEKIDALDAAINAFNSAAAAYDAFAAAVATEQAELPYALATKYEAIAQAKAAEPMTAEEATAAANNIYAKIRGYVESNGMAEGVEGAEDMTELILNPNSNDGVNSWTTTLGEGSGGAIDIKNNEPFTDGAGNSTHNYFDGGNWGAQAWDVTFSQNVTLAPGKYLLTATSRASADVTFTLFAGEESVAMPTIGASGGVFNRGWNDTSLEFVVTTTGEVAIGVQGVTKVQHNWMSFTRFRLVNIEKATEAIEITPVGYATYCSANALDFTNVEGLTAYTATMDGSTVKFEKVEGTVPAGTGLLVKGESAVVPVVASSETVVESNILVGVLEDTPVDAGIYVLMKSETGAAAFVKTENSFTVRANSAYLPAISEARIIAIEGEATGIETVKAAKTADAIYNLAGQRVVKAQKGLYIQNGKKHIVK